MKIKRVEFQNFRNFKDFGFIDFPDDSNISIIYGPNGNGKTTFHQLLHWVVYGTYKFNATAGDILYNLDVEDKASIDDVLTVYGKIDFDHPNANGVIESYVIFI